MFLASCCTSLRKATTLPHSAVRIIDISHNVIRTNYANALGSIALRVGERRVPSAYDLLDTTLFLINDAAGYCTGHCCCDKASVIKHSLQRVCHNYDRMVDTTRNGILMTLAQYDTPLFSEGSELPGITGWCLQRTVGFLGAS